MNLTLFSQDIENLLEALKLPGLFQGNASAQIANFENLTRIRGTFDNVKVRKVFVVFVASILNSCNPLGLVRQ